MSSQVSTFSIKHSNALLSGTPIEGFDDSEDSFMIEPITDAAQFMTGADGYAVISQTNDRSHKLILKLLASSPTHEYLLKLANFSRRGGKPAELSFSFRDTGSGEGGQSDCVYIIKEPAQSRGTKQGNRVWELLMVNYEPTNVTTV